MNSSSSPFLFVGDHPALDLLNTVVGLGDERRDLLDTPRALHAWLAAMPWPMPEAQALPLGGAPRAAEWEDALAQVRQLREEGRGLVDAWRGGTLSAVRLARLRGWMAQVDYRLDLQRDGEAVATRWVPQLPGPRALPALLAASFAELLAGTPAASVKTCAGEGCALCFADRTKAGRRLFCSAALCGNRAKVAAFRARQREG